MEYDFEIGTSSADIGAAKAVPACLCRHIQGIAMKMVNNLPVAAHPTVLTYIFPEDMLQRFHGKWMNTIGPTGPGWFITCTCAPRSVDGDVLGAMRHLGDMLAARVVDSESNSVWTTLSQFRINRYDQGAAARDTGEVAERVCVMLKGLGHPDDAMANLQTHTDDPASSGYGNVISLSEFSIQRTLEEKCGLRPPADGAQDVRVSPAILCSQCDFLNDRCGRLPCLRVSHRVNRFEAIAETRRNCFSWIIVLNFGLAPQEWERDRVLALNHAVSWTVHGKVREPLFLSEG